MVKKILGQGGMGAALLATDIRLDGKLVVIKELISDNVDQDSRLEDVRNFKREVSTLAHIDHPLVPNVTDHFQEGTRYFMVQEYVDGENLEEHLNHLQRPMTERETLICGSEVLDILDYLSQLMPPIVHRDIKPANIIIGTKDRRAHLVDFGIARADEIKNAQRKQTSALGTPGYAPPEQYQGNADPRSDLYALAATLHHVLTNRDPRNYPPFYYAAARSLNAQLSPEIEGILIKALNNDINQRFQSAASMKQEIDLLLRQRFGLSGNIDTYTLGTSGNLGATQASTAQTQTSGPNYPPTQVAGPTPIPSTPLPVQPTPTPTPPPPPPHTPIPSHSGASLTPVQPLPNFGPTSGSNYTYPIQPPQASHMVVQPPPYLVQPPPAKKKRRGGLIFLILLLVILLIASGIFVTNYYFVGANKPKPVEAPAIGVTMINGEPIGISDGTVALDTTLADGSLKTQAAQQFKLHKDDTNEATSLLNEAITKNSNDAEALIYKENIRVINSGTPYVTLVVATMISGDQLDTGRDDLQGAYVAQKEFNDSGRLSNGTLVRLLIANSGSKTDNVVKVAQQIVRLQKTDPTFVGVMGWPYSGRTLAAIQTLSKSQIPMLSQTASSDGLTNASPYFFRVAPANKQQGIQGAIYAEKNLHAKTTALFYDPKDSYSQSLAQDFRQQFEGTDKNTIINEQYTIGNQGSINKAIQDASTKNIDLIYFSGYATDVSTVLSNLPPGKLPVMGGDALYQLGGYQSSAKANFSRLHFTAFAYPDEWDVFKYSAQKPAFFSEYSAAFNPDGQQGGGKYGFTRAANDVILSYDATITLLTAYNMALNAGKKQPTPKDMRDYLLKINGANTIQGVSGQISLGPNGDPIEKSILVLYVDEIGRIHMEPAALGRFLKQK
ncbi:bifunctional serine/threonine-protein kinase/ABC transporter substrate-binding protein [Dictyobacter alpinus]|uniref:bifunctional serine/threonine-protein kinase/ABC transporter substrate-binding protein n=1 Tax=Dictyobacter alpinus TaxID=2014873 RepID=UPI0013874439|nr:bifunctional serine/threonine-protein kinase/ABC transporter substrate-binding protein [Dictyobacter alpinus]